MKKALCEALLRQAEGIHTLAQATAQLSPLQELEFVQSFSIRDIDLATGTVSCDLGLPEKLFYEILSAQAGMPIRTDAELLKLLTELSAVKKEYDRVSDALAAVKNTGYGVVMPAPEEMKLEQPELLKKNGINTAFFSI